MKLTLYVVFLCLSVEAIAQVGIGTTSPDSSAVLDLSSPSKGLMLPRVSDTSSVDNPNAGLIVYNLNENAPYYFNGSNWQSMNAMSMMMTPNSTDSVTYRITGPGGSSERPLTTMNFSYTGGIGAAGAALNFSKGLDESTSSLLKWGYGDVLPNSIEFKFYEAGASTAHIWVAIENVTIVAQSAGLGENGWSEAYTCTYTFLAYKDFNDTTGWRTDLNGTFTGGYPGY